MAKIIVGKKDAGVPLSGVTTGVRRLVPAKPAKVAAFSDLGREDAIYIPEAARKTRLMTFPISVSTLYFLNYHDFWVLGDLHGRSFSEIRQRRWCDAAALAEVRQLVQSLQQTHGLSAANIRELRQRERDALDRQFQPMRRTVRLRRSTRAQAPGLSAATFNVPAHVRTINPFDLPLSVRLQGVLGRGGVRCLGDLHAVPVSRLREVKNCGARSVAELNRLIQRAAAGEFSPPPAGAAWEPAELVRTFDTVVAALPDRSRKILRLRLGTGPGRKPTLQTLADQFGLTRERVRQIIELELQRIRKAGSLRLQWHLEQMAARCRAAGRPLSSGLLGEWLRASSARCQFSPVFYVRLIGCLHPGIQIEGR